MVFFVCEGCNESLKKNKVDSHAERCNSCWAVTCVDCNKTFEGDDYRTHTSCISEAEKYEGACFNGNKTSNTKAINVQEKWIAAVQSVVCSDPKLKSFVTQIQSYDNVPRKKAKFLNFLKNSINVRNPGTAEQLWKVLEAEFAKYQVVNEPKEAPKEPEEEKMTTKKRTRVDIADLKWSKVIRRKLKSSPDCSLKLKELKKAVIATFREKHADQWTDVELKSAFKQKIQTMSSSLEIKGKQVQYIKSN